MMIPSFPTGCHLWGLCVIAKDRCMCENLLQLQSLLVLFVSLGHFTKLGPE